MKRWSLIPALALLASCGHAPLPAAELEAAAALEAQRHHASPAVGTENFKKVTAYLYRGGLPQDADMTALSKLGVTTDVDLMGGGAQQAEKDDVAHEADVAKGLGMTFINLPIPFNVPFPSAMAEQFLATVDAESKIPGHAVYVHCVHGRDRTGTMVSYFRIEHDGWTPTRALTDQETFGFKPADYPTFVTFLTGLAK